MAKKFFRGVSFGMVALKVNKIKRIGCVGTYSPKTKNPQTLVKVGWANDGREKITRVIKPFDVKHKFLGALTVSIRETNHELDTFLIELSNSLKRVFSSESLIIEPQTKKMRGLCISTAEEYRATKKGRRHGFGELVRLTSIMEMLENKCEFLSIFAKNSAIFFHGKYKFQPNIADKKEAMDALLTVIKDKSLNFKSLSLRAKKLYIELEKNETMSDEQKTAIFKKVNNLLNQYIKKALAEGKNGLGHEFEKGISMILTKDAVQKEKNFFNQRYAAQGIDYKI